MNSSQNPQMLQDMSQALSQVRKLSSQISQAKVLVIGDIGLDEYTQGAVRRISPEAPVPVVEVSQQEKRVGLAGNVALNVISFGGQAKLLGVVGADAAGEELKTLLEKRGVNCEDWLKDSERPTTRKLRVMSGQHHLLRVDYEKKVKISEDVQSQLLKTVRDQISEFDVVILQDYAKGVVQSGLVSRLVEIANQSQKPIFADPHPSTSLEEYRGVHFMTPNRDEAFLLTGQSLAEDSDLSEEGKVQAAAARIRKDLGLEDFAITRGSQGVSLFSTEGVTHLPTFARQVFDVTGAGDTVIAAFAVGRAVGMNLVESGLFANLAAGVVVAKLGCATAEPSEVFEFAKRVYPGTQ